jgi:hypothetical protein
MLSHIYYQIIIFLYTKYKLENITLMENQEASLPGPLPSPGIKPPEETVLQAVCGGSHL